MLVMLSPVLIRWAVLAALCAAFGGSAYVAGLTHEKKAWQAADAAKEAKTSAAMVARMQSNATESAKQSEINATITERTHEELSPIVKRIYVDRVRVGPSLCGGTPPTAQTESAGSSNAADPPGRLVPDQLEGRIRELEIRVEEALATGRACQAFVRENGMAP